jgi:hypothetical protein
LSRGDGRHHETGRGVECPLRQGAIFVAEGRTAVACRGGFRSDWTIGVPSGTRAAAVAEF